MSNLREAAQQAIALVCSARLCEINSMSSRQEMLRLMIEATDTLRAALAEPVQEPFFTEANGFPQTFVPKDRQKQAIISLTDQCAALIQERDELQKQVWLYEKNGVTCQTYRHTVEQSCAECNVQMNYTTPSQRKPLTDEEIMDIVDKERAKVLMNEAKVAYRVARAIERAHGII